MGVRAHDRAVRFESKATGKVACKVCGDVWKDLMGSGGCLSRNGSTSLSRQPSEYRAPRRLQLGRFGSVAGRKSLRPGYAQAFLCGVHAQPGRAAAAEMRRIDRFCTKPAASGGHLVTPGGAPGGCRRRNCTARCSVPRERNDALTVAKSRRLQEQRARRRERGWMAQLGWNGAGGGSGGVAAAAATSAGGGGGSEEARTAGAVERDGGGGSRWWWWWWGAAAVTSQRGGCPRGARWVSVCDRRPLVAKRRSRRPMWGVGATRARAQGSLPYAGIGRRESLRSQALDGPNRVSRSARRRAGALRRSEGVCVCAVGGLMADARAGRQAAAMLR